MQHGNVRILLFWAPSMLHQCDSPGLSVTLVGSYSTHTCILPSCQVPAPLNYTLNFQHEVAADEAIHTCHEMKLLDG